MIFSYSQFKRLTKKSPTRTITKAPKHRKGFTLVETLVAIAILMLAITGPLTAASKALNIALTTRDQVVATFLVQDVHEYIQSIKDSNVYNSAGWLESIKTANDGSLCTQANPCIIDTSRVSGAPNVATRPSQTFTTQLYRDSLGRFTHVESDYTPTNFSREFYVEESQVEGYGNRSQARVVVTVRWMNGSTPFETTFETYIYRVVQ